MKIVCIGRNYGEHARELGNEIPEEPVIFMKPSTALLGRDEAFTIPAWSADIHFELEVVLRISKRATAVSIAEASGYYDALSLGIDFTDRGLQSKLKDKGLSWEKAKAFDGSAAIGSFKKVSSLGDLNALSFTLTQNEQVVQRGNSSHMLFSIDRLVSEASQYFTLEPGDLLYTGTPPGVGPVATGDTLIGRLGEDELLRVSVR